MRRNDKRQSIYGEYLDGLMTDGEWFLKPRRYAKIMTPAESDFVCHLLNVGRPHDKVDERGFMMATTRFVEDGTGLTPAEQRDVVDVLRGLGVVEVEHRGEPTRRYVRIDVAQIELLVADPRQHRSARPAARKGRIGFGIAIRSAR